MLLWHAPHVNGSWWLINGSCESFWFHVTNHGVNAIHFYRFCFIIIICYKTVFLCLFVSKLKSPTFSFCILGLTFCLWSIRPTMMVRGFTFSKFGGGWRISGSELQKNIKATFGYPSACIMLFYSIVNIILSSTATPLGVGKYMQLFNYWILKIVTA